MGRWAAPSTPPTHFIMLAQFWPFLGSLYWAIQLKIWNATLPLPVWENLFLLYHVIWGASLNYIHVGSGSRKDLRIRKSGNGSFAQFPGADTLSWMFSPNIEHFNFTPLSPVLDQQQIVKQKPAACLTFNSLFSVDCVQACLCHCVTTNSPFVLVHNLCNAILPRRVHHDTCCFFPR